MNINIVLEADLVSIIAAAIAFLAMIFTWRQARIAKREYKISKALYDERKPNFEIVEIPDAHVINDFKRDSVIIRIELIVLNKSSRTMSINNLQLVVCGENGELVINSSNNTETLSSGTNIDPNSSIRKWSEFILKREYYNTLGILEYKIIVKDHLDNESLKTMAWIKEERFNYGEKDTKNYNGE